ncbi:hypothetical protein BO71DRAFT_15823 [Aspergillus ellipticus CBS 707.79]|uniref:Uncharacterized protein n=1 Tax=Aspergillus ellipticus CBS 707.79 TaxID=1448320 RepID=A0A319D6C8_9EURO|nr:hypothetical protein BO71DRAFT_15823 [Aspergillus ellipticus CBS 707.79]
MLALLFEWESGSPAAVHAHLRGAEAIVLANHRAISLSNSGWSLLCAWAEFHAIWEAHLLPFRRAEIDKLISVPRILAQNFADRRVRMPKPVELLSNLPSHNYLCPMCGPVLSSGFLPVWSGQTTQRFHRTMRTFSGLYGQFAVLSSNRRSSTKS